MASTPDVLEGMALGSFEDVLKAGLVPPEKDLAETVGSVLIASAPLVLEGIAFGSLEEVF